MAGNAGALVEGGEHPPSGFAGHPLREGGFDSRVCVGPATVVVAWGGEGE